MGLLVLDRFNVYPHVKQNEELEGGYQRQSSPCVMEMGRVVSGKCTTYIER